MTEEIKELYKKSYEDDRTILRLESQYGVQYDRAEKLSAENNRLKEEVSRLQREYCHTAAMLHKTTPAKVAEELGWDCFWNLSEVSDGN